MAKHSASVVVGAPVGQVYRLFTHFSDFPKFMSNVKSITLIDDERSHWVVDILGDREWDAVNENWIADQQIGWRSIGGLDNTGLVRFEADGEDRTLMHVDVEYEPNGLLGSVGEVLGGGAELARRYNKNSTISPKWFTPHHRVRSIQTRRRISSTTTARPLRAM